METSAHFLRTNTYSVAASPQLSARNWSTPITLKYGLKFKMP